MPTLPRATEGLTVLYEDDALLVVDKPAWLVVHRGLRNDRDTLVGRVRRRLGVRTVHPVHRLDRQTSGVLVFARDAAAAAVLRRSFEAGEVHKAYWALVRGRAPERAVVERPVPAGPGGPRVPARTRIRRLAFARIEPREVSLVACYPESGRYHQLRRHLRHLDHPILLDANYGPTRLNRAFRERWGLSRLMLHAWSLSLPHPVTGERLRWCAPLPASFLEPLRAMGCLPPKDLLHEAEVHPAQASPVLAEPPADA